MTIRVVQFSLTPLAGAPIRIAQAVNEHTSIEVRHVDLKRWGIFDHDHVHYENQEKTLELALKADIIHFYNYLDLNSRDFYPVDFKELEANGKKFVRHFQSTPERVSTHTGVSVSEILNDPVPKIVVAQYPERFFPTARVVPNIVPENLPLYLPNHEKIEWDIFHGPSNSIRAWGNRWESKGRFETLQILKAVRLESGYTFRSVTGIPLKELMLIKRRCGIIIDELVSGSYHLAALEGLCLGRPVLAYLDSRTDHVMRFIAGAGRTPFVNLRLEDAKEVIKWLVSHPIERAEIGKASREWLEKHWSSAMNARHFERMYRDLLDDPMLIKRQRHLRIDSPGQKFFSLHLHDAIYRSRSEHTRFFRLINIISKTLNLFKEFVHQQLGRVRLFFKKHLMI